jgi:hypothetical protein
MVIHTHFKQFVKPQEEEGFDLIQTLQWTRTTVNEEDDSKNALESARLFQSYLPNLKRSW